MLIFEFKIVTNISCHLEKVEISRSKYFILMETAILANISSLNFKSFQGIQFSTSRRQQMYSLQR